jgi:hypothetical protein
MKIIKYSEVYKNLVRTSQEKLYIFTTKTNRLILFRETEALTCEEHTKDTNTLFAENEEFFFLSKKWYIQKSLGFKR